MVFDVIARGQYDYECKQIVDRFFDGHLLVDDHTQHALNTVELNGAENITRAVISSTSFPSKHPKWSKVDMVVELRKQTDIRMRGVLISFIDYMRDNTEQHPRSYLAGSLRADLQHFSRYCEEAPDRPLFQSLRSITRLVIRMHAVFQYYLSAALLQATSSNS